MIFTGPFQWSPEAAEGLNGCGSEWPADYAAEQIKAGRFQLWKFGESWLLLENCKPNLFIWCYQGRDAVAMWIALAKLIYLQGFDTLECFTHHKGFVRAFRRFSPRIEKSDSGEMRCLINVRELMRYEHQNAGSFTVRRSSLDFIQCESTGH